MSDPIFDPFGGGGDAIPPPDLVPVPDLPPEVPETPFPPIGPPLKYVVHGAHAAWSDIASWVSDTWHRATSGYDNASIAIYDGVKKIVDQAVNASQTAWSTFASALEDQLLTNVQTIIGDIDRVTADLYNNVNTLWEGLTFADASIRSWASNAFHAIEHLLEGVATDAENAVKFADVSIRQWVLDDIFQPLEEDILRTAQEIYHAIDWETANLQNQLNDLNASILPALAGGIAALTAAQAQTQQWMDDCGEPMCEEYGPKTDLSKLLKDAKLLEFLGWIAALAALGDPQLVADAAQEVVKVIGPPIELVIADWLVPLQASTPG